MSKLMQISDCNLKRQGGKYYTDVHMLTKVLHEDKQYMMECTNLKIKQLLNQ